MIISSRIDNLIDKYSFFAFDLWGVIHDGEKLYPNVAKVLDVLQEKNKLVAFISNAPRRSAKAKEVLNNLKIDSSSYLDIIPSGACVFNHLKHNQQNYSKFGKKFFYFGPDKDKSLLAGLEYDQTNVDNADFVVLTGLTENANVLADDLSLINKITARNLPIICANPDLKVVKQSGEELCCAGVVAKEFQDRGLNVAYFGKPYLSIYQELLNIFGKSNNSKINIDKSKILAIGDSVETDLAGALEFGIDIAFTTCGIYRPNFTNISNHHKVLEDLIRSKIVNFDENRQNIWLMNGLDFNE